MKNFAIISASFLMFGCASGLDTGADPSLSADRVGDNGLVGQPEPHLFMAKDAKPNSGGTNPDMTNHGGTVLTPSVTMAIFWGPSWDSYTGDKISGLDTFFQGFGTSVYAQASTEYSGTNGQVSDASHYNGHVIDSSSPPAHKALSTSQAVAEGCKITGNNPDPNALYLIYTENGPSHASYCAWHSWGTCSNGAQIQVAYMPNIDGIAGCNPGAPASLGQSEGLSALANVTAHELSEAITDPRGNTWYDSSGQENGDKCAWSFNGTTTFSNGSVWYLQGEWSNSAYDSGTGYANRSGQKGCLPN